MRSERWPFAVGLTIGLAALLPGWAVFSRRPPPPAACAPPPSPPPTVVSKLLPKSRAASIDVESHRAVDGLVSAGDHVDVLVTMTDPQTDERVARTLIQNVVVLSVTHRPPPELDSVTLLVLTQEAEALLLAQELGRFALILRNPADPDVPETEGRTSINTLLSGERLVHWTHPRSTIQVIR